MGKKKISSLCLCAILFALCVIAEGQETRKIPRVGYLTSTEPPYETFRKESIRQALRELGYIEGQNIAIEYRYAEGKMDRLPELAAELVRLNVNVIVAAGGDGVIRAANNASKTIPIVMTGQGSDPVESGLVKSLSRPGGYITGVTNLLVQLGDKRLELLKEAVPKIARVAVLYVPGDRTHGLELKEVQSAAPALGVNIQTREVRGANDFDSVFSAVDKDRPDALHVLGGSLMRDNRKRIIGFASKRRLPSVYDTRRAVDAGGLMSYGADLVDSYRRVAWYVDKILKGAKPADLPVEQPRKFELAINLKTAKQIGLTIPPNVLARADRVIK
jgi:putative tryptophan/tyrosine transport system substrate-binding protein